MKYENRFVGKHLYVVWMDGRRRILVSKKITNFVKEGEDYSIGPIFPVLKASPFTEGSPDVLSTISFIDLMNIHIEEIVCYIGAIITSTKPFGFETQWILKNEDKELGELGYFYPYSGCNKTVFVKMIYKPKDYKEIRFRVLDVGLDESE